jgi:hypothetical protein
MSRKISYAFRDDGVYAIENGQVIAHADSLEHIALSGQDVRALETVTEHARAELGGSGMSGGAPVSYDTAYDGDTEGLDRMRGASVKTACSCSCGDCEDGDHCKSCSEKTANAATHIVTPNGLRGKIMGKVVPGLWGNEVTVRFENGHIARLQVADVELSSDAPVRQTLASAKAATGTPDTHGTRLAFLREKLAEAPEGDAASLRSRLVDLRDIQEIATELASKPRIASVVREELDSIRAEAAYESSEVKDALEYLQDAEAYAPPQHFATHVAEQATIGGFGGGQWLDQTYEAMVREADETDFDQLLNEGPEVFIADLDPNLLADQGTTAQLATSYIESKVAAARPEVREKYTELWVERVEGARREAFASRKETVAKQAAADSDLYDNLPDDCLFS